MDKGDSEEEDIEGLLVYIDELIAEMLWGEVPMVVVELVSQEEMDGEIAYLDPGTE